MKVLGAKKMSIHALHQPIQHIAGSIAARMVIGGRIEPVIFPKLFNGFRYDSRHILRRAAPFSQSSDPLAKRFFVGCPIAIS
jgi:hypothetical protein